MLPLYTDPSYLLDKLSCFRHDEFPATALLQNSSLMSFESNNHLGLSVQEEVNIKKNGTNNVVRRKPARNDRHSKIYTAQGLRERRIRLSLEVARKFFALQDMLGFDKASTTVDWLMTQSKSAIDHEHVVNQQSKDGSSPMKRVKDQNNDQALLGQPKAESSSSTLRKRVSLHQLPTKGSRAEARARARERTKEKKKKKKEEEELLSDSQFGGGQNNYCCGEFLPLVMNGDDQYSGQQSNYSKNNYLISCSTSDDSLNFFQEQMNNIDGELIFG